MAVSKTFWPLSREPLVQLAQFKACWMRNFQDIKLVGQSKLSRGPEVARGPEVEYHCHTEHRMNVFAYVFHQFGGPCDLKMV